MMHGLPFGKFVLIALFLLSGMTLSGQIDAWAESTEICLGEPVTINSVIELPVEEYNPVYFDHNDTVFNGIFDIGFDFKFFETIYKKFVIAPNGWISFNTALAGTFDDWHSTAIPSSTAPKNAILFPWQDWYPYVDDGSYVGWATLGYAPTRRLIVNFFNVKLAGNESSNERGTFQLKLFEISNKIEVHITKKPSSGDYLDNIATIGVNDEQGIRSFTPTIPDRNGSSWTTENEAWQFGRTGNPGNAYGVVSIDFDPELIGEISAVKWYENTVDDSHLLSTGNTLSTYPTQTTSYIARILVNNSVPYTDTVTIVVNPLPIADAGDDTIIFNGDPAYLHGNATGGTPPYNYFWKSAVGPWHSYEQNPVLYPDISMEYQLYVIDSKGCTSLTDYVVVQVTNSPLFAIIHSSDSTICKGADVTLTVDTYGGEQPYSYAWEAVPPVSGWVPEDSPVQTVSPEDTTTFYSFITDNDGAIDTVTTTVNVISVQPSIEGTADVCELQAGVIYTAPSTGNIFLWSMSGDVPGNLSFSNNVATVNFGAGSGINKISVVETTNDLYKCSGMAEIFVTIHPKPSPSILDDGGNPVCQGTLNVLYYTDLYEGHSYKWDMVYNYGTFVGSDSIHDQVRIDWHLPGTELLALQEISEFGCDRTVTREIVINPNPTPLISGREMICEKETTTYATIYFEDHTYKWDTASPFPGSLLNSPVTNELTIKWEKSGTASMTVYETDTVTGCAAVSEPFNATVHPKPVIDIADNTYLSVCNGDSALIGLTGGDLYYWQPYQDMTWVNDSTWWASPGMTMNYVILGEDTLTGCFSDTLSLDVEIKPNPVIDLGEDQYISPGETIVLDPGSGFDEYEWNTGSLEQKLQVTSAGYYEVWVGLKGCTAQDSIWIKMPAGLLPIPNAFTPNSDGHNDTFGLEGSLEEITQFNMQIFNRWGAKIYETTDPSQPWDGTYQGILCDTGTYLWIISLEEKSLGQNTTKRGYVTLLR
ncbi:MAG TPA: gliding motility-associated C-terminal domain-containing protein [Bacteroidales bacterium]|nr:gliding motility-associated C-terminal domain-containing protein [Bacteroidales bacterium]